MPMRTAEAQWRGSLSEGDGTTTHGSGGFEGRYSFGTRFAWRRGPIRKN